LDAQDQFCYESPDNEEFNLTTCLASDVDNIPSDNVKPIDSQDAEINRILSDETTSTEDPSSDGDDMDNENSDDATSGDEPCVASEEGPWTAKRPFSTEDTLLIFDWDDTILPSTWVQSQELSLQADSIPTEEQFACLNSLSRRAYITLETAKRLGTVVFITNAETGWIELSCKKFMPSLLPLLKDVKLLSARSTYESAAYRSPSAWKAMAFEDEIQDFCSQRVMSTPDQRLNLISFGDSQHEREALFRATSELPQCCRKSLKFLDQPSWAVLARQHEFVSAYFQQIVDHDATMDLCLRCS